MRVGIDIIENGRFARVLARRSRLADRVFTRREREYCLSKRVPARHYAARFAAKEAVGKALGTGVISWQEIEVVNSGGGRPQVSVSGATAEVARRAGAVSLELSLSHSDSVSVAVVVAKSGNLNR